MRGMPDQKPRPRVKNVELLRRIHEAYQLLGCSFCGRRASIYALGGTKVEVHHIIPRSRGGDDSWENTVGLCGPLAGCKMHALVEDHRYEIRRINDAVWLCGPDMMHRLVQAGG